VILELKKFSIFDNQPKLLVKNSRIILAGYATASGFFAAKFFGAISAKTIIRIVSTNVPAQTY
jgi:hypothetical protein